jgi:hypothetical protein
MTISSKLCNGFQEGQQVEQEGDAPLNVILIA